MTAAAKIRSDVIAFAHTYSLSASGWASTRAGGGRGVVIAHKNKPWRDCFDSWKDAHDFLLMVKRGIGRGETPPWDYENTGSARGLRWYERPTGKAA